MSSFFQIKLTVLKLRNFSEAIYRRLCLFQPPVIFTKLLGLQLYTLGFCREINHYSVVTFAQLFCVKYRKQNIFRTIVIQSKNKDKVKGGARIQKRYWKSMVRTRNQNAAFRKVCRAHRAHNFLLHDGYLDGQIFGRSNSKSQLSPANVQMVKYLDGQSAGSTFI